MASTSETGWPYIQYRGGEKGFLRILDDKTLGFADLRGNKQYISTGNLQHDNRVALFFMDYAHQQRLKILGRAEVHEGDEDRAEAHAPAHRSRRENSRRARRAHPRRSLRLELPAAHHPALHRRRAGSIARPHTPPSGSSRRRKHPSEDRPVSHRQANSHSSY